MSKVVVFLIKKARHVCIIDVYIEKTWNIVVPQCQSSKYLKLVVIIVLAIGGIAVAV